MLKYEPGDVVREPNQKRFIHKWRLETLVNELLTHPKASLKHGVNRKLNHENFNGIANVFNILGKLEDAEYGRSGHPRNIREELARIGHRQFDWQRSVFNEADLTRSLILFNGANASAYFLDRYGLSVADFMTAGFGMWLQLQKSAFFVPPLNVPEVGLTPEVFALASPLMIISEDEARTEAVALRRAAQAPTAYKPSLLRRFPCISFGQGTRIRAPLQDLVFARITSGLYYDVVGGRRRVNTEIGNRFEKYCLELLSESFSESTWMPAVEYQLNGASHTPDILLMEAGQCKLVLECKAKRMTMGARFGEDPYAEAKVGFDEIAYGVFQTWRYFSHSRRGMIPGHSTSDDAFGVVLTLDPWLRMASDRYTMLLGLANTLADADEEIVAEDRRPVAFCSVQDLEALCRKASLTSLVETFRRAASEEYAGYLLSVLHDEFAPNPPINRDYPFGDQIGDHFPWWGEIGQ